MCCVVVCARTSSDISILVVVMPTKVISVCLKISREQRGCWCLLPRFMLTEFGLVV